MPQLASMTPLQVKRAHVRWRSTLASEPRRAMVALSVLATHRQSATPGAGTSEFAEVYAPSILFDEDLAEQEEIMSNDSDFDTDPLIASTDGPPRATAKAMRRQKSIQFAALCMALYMAGWSDATAGPLIPRLQEVYHVSDGVKSCCWNAPDTLSYRSDMRSCPLFSSSLPS